MMGELPSEKHYEDNEIFAFSDINSKAPIHVLIMPKKHIVNVNDPAVDGIIGKCTKVVRDIAKKMGITDTGYRLVINCNKDGGQVVDHLHIHLLGGRQLNWPPG